MVTIDELFQAYYDCRKNKRWGKQQLEFEENLFDNLIELYNDLIQDRYEISQSTVFVIKTPKPREVWSANFRDRVVHHLLYNRVKDFYFKKFDPYSCACLPKRGTLFASNSAHRAMRKTTKDWTQPKYYLKCDIKNFFTSINKIILLQNIKRDFPADTIEYKYFEKIIMNDPTLNFKMNSSRREMNLVLPHKKLTNAKPLYGLPIGNLSSQLCGNIYLHELDFFVRHKLQTKYYFRYVDDFLIFGDSNQQLQHCFKQIKQFLADNLELELNNSKTIIQPISNGVRFVGHVLKPYRTYTQRSTTNRAFFKLKIDSVNVNSVNSYFGLFRQTKSFNIRKKYGEALLQKNINTNTNFTKGQLWHTQK